MDSDGSIHLDEKLGLLTVSVTQKNKYLLEPLIHLYGGKIYILSPKVEAFKYTIFKKKEILNLVDDYFKKYPLKSGKADKLNLIKDYYILRAQPKGRNLNNNKINEYIFLIVSLLFLFNKTNHQYDY